VEVGFEDGRDGPGANDVELETVDGLNKKAVTR